MYKTILKTLVLFIALILVTSTMASAQALQFFDDEGLFNNTCDNLAVEGFENTNVPPNDVESCPGPFNSFTNNICYSPGALIPGFSLSGSTDPGNPILVLTPPFSGLTNVAVGASVGTDKTVITFTEVVNTFGMVIVSSDVNSTVEVQVFGGGAGNIFLGSTTVNVTPVNGTFLGVLSVGGPITRIELGESGQPQLELLYELSFGTCGSARPIPTLSEWGLIAVALVLGIIGLLAIHGRRVTI